LVALFPIRAVAVMQRFKVAEFLGSPFAREVLRGKGTWGKGMLR